MMQYLWMVATRGDLWTERAHTLPPIIIEADFRTPCGGNGLTGAELFHFYQDRLYVSISIAS